MACIGIARHTGPPRGRLSGVLAQASPLRAFHAFLVKPVLCFRASTGPPRVSRVSEFRHMLNRERHPII